MKSKILIFLGVIACAGLLFGQAVVKNSGGTYLLYNGSANANYGGFSVSPDASGSSGAIITSSSFEQFSYNQPVTSGTYGTGLCLGGTMSLVSPARQNGGTAELKSVYVIDANAPAGHIPMSILFFDCPPASLTGTYTDRAPVGLPAGDVTHLIRTVNVTAAGYVQVNGTNGGVEDISVNEPVLLSSTTNGMTAVAEVTGTSAGTSGTTTETFRFDFNKD